MYKHQLYDLYPAGPCCSSFIYAWKLIMSDRERRAALRAILAARHAWEIFGLPRGGNIARSEVQKQYRAMAKLVHPDKFTDPGSKSAMQKLNEALETLSDQALRAEETTPPASTAMSEK